MTGERESLFAALHDDALQVVVNAYGTKPRHTQARLGDCRDDCIPCGIARLARHFPENSIAEEPARFGPICEVDDGSYRAVDRDGVLVVERADSAGALRHVEWESEEQRERWEAAIRREETTRSR